MNEKATSIRPILIFDGMNCFIRHFMANETMNVSGELIGGTVGTLKQIADNCQQYKPQLAIIVWEQGGGSPRRKHVFSEYKANRAKQKEFQGLYKTNNKINPQSDPENKTRQLVLLTELLDFLPVCQVYVSETECDDIIAYLVKNKYKHQEVQKIVVSTDKDFYQLLEDPYVRIYNQAKHLLIDANSVIEQYSVAPRNMTLARSLVGDDSDNIPGVPGLGLKTVAKRFPELINDQYDYSIDWILEGCRNLIGPKQPKCFQAIIENEDIIRRNWELMYLNNSMLSANQIAKINGRIDQYEPNLDTFAFMKHMVKNHISVGSDLNSIPQNLKFLTL